MTARRLMAVGWSSFLAACALEFLVFACLDPGELQGLSWWRDSSRQTVYALSFFAFWAIAAAGCALAVLLTLSAGELNGVPGLEDRERG